MDATKYTIPQLEHLRATNNTLFERLNFEDMKAGLLKQIFPFLEGKGNKHPHKSERINAAAIREWRRKTKEEQEAFVQTKKSNSARDSRVRRREETTQDGRDASRRRSETPALEPEPSEAEDEPDSERAGSHMVSRADSQAFREAFIAELEAQEPVKATPHHVGKPPLTIQQQNDGVVIDVKKGMIKYFMKFKNMITPRKRITQAAHPRQRTMLVIINDLEDPPLGGSVTPLDQVRRKKPQMIVCAESRNEVSDIVGVLCSAFASSSIAHEKYEHIRIFDDEDLKRHMETTFKRKRETLKVPKMDNAIDAFVSRAPRPRSNSF